MNTERNYLVDKVIVKRSALKFVWLPVAFAAVFVFIILRVAISGSGGDVLSHAPNNDEVYTIARYFITPTVKEAHPVFRGSPYQFNKKDDSVYIIKSFVETNSDSGEKLRTNFEVTLKYKGGDKLDKSNWDLLNLNED